MAVRNFCERKIGNKLVQISYDPGGKQYALQSLDKEEAAYLEACETAEMSVERLVDEYRRLHDVIEDIRQRTCVVCGHQALKERRGRMRVFGGLFWTNSKPAPFKHCANCGHDQEYNPYSPRHDESFIKQAERRIDGAKKLRAKYEASPPKSIKQQP